MTEPAFDSRTPRLALPMLFPGQSQRETYVNESLARIDALMHCAITAVTADPPANPPEGGTWIVADNPSGAWSGKSGHLAWSIGGNWFFQAPFDGLRVYDRAVGRDMRYAGTWIAASLPTAPVGGATVDQEARETLAAVIDCLIAAGILSSD